MKSLHVIQLDVFKWPPIEFDLLDSDLVTPALIWWLRLWSGDPGSDLVTPCCVSAVLPAAKPPEAWPEWQCHPEASSRGGQLHAAGGAGHLQKRYAQTHTYTHTGTQPHTHNYTHNKHPHTQKHQTPHTPGLENEIIFQSIRSERNRYIQPFRSCVPSPTYRSWTGSECKITFVPAVLLGLVYLCGWYIKIDLLIGICP